MKLDACAIVSHSVAQTRKEQLDIYINTYILIKKLFYVMNEAISQ